MTLPGARLFEHVGRAGGGAIRRVVGDAQGSGDCVGAVETDAAHLGEAVGLRADETDRVFSETAIDLDRIGRRDSVALKENHHVADRPGLVPGLENLFFSFLANPPDLTQAMWLQSEDVERFLAELADDFFRQVRADTVDEAGEIHFDAREARGLGRMEGRDF